jgi:SAM-dependent methyltransferase
MHPIVFAVFDEICRVHLSPGARVLEIGAMPVADTLLRLPALRPTSRQAATQQLRVGVNLAILHPDPDLALVQVAADGLAAFADASFDAVLCNSVLEHDPHFWRTCNGMLRVARSGALIAIGVPGYADLPPRACFASRAAPRGSASPRPCWSASRPAGKPRRRPWACTTTPATTTASASRPCARCCWPAAATSRCA